MTAVADEDLEAAEATGYDDGFEDGAGETYREWCGHLVFIADAVRRAHDDDGHAGLVRWCERPACKAVRRAFEDPGRGPGLAAAWEAWR